jgi:hypothetical protein
MLFGLAARAMAGAVAHWTFEEGAIGAVADGAAAVLDQTGSHSGTPIGSPVYRSAPTPTGGAVGLEFPAGPDRVFVPDSGDFALTSLTIEAFIVPPPASSHYSLVFLRGDDRVGYDPYSLQYNQDGNGKVAFDIGAGTDHSRIYSAPLTPGQIVHVAGTFDSATGQEKLYINHEPVATTATSLRPLQTLTGANPGLGIGNNQTGTFGGENFPGIIAEVRLSNVALTPDQFLPVPEPATQLLMILAAIGWFLRRHRAA